MRSHGWYTAPLRAYARTVHALAADPAILLDVAERALRQARARGEDVGVMMLQPSLRQVRQRRVPARRALARPRVVMGRSRRPRHVPARPDDGRRSAARARPLLGRVAQPLASPRRGRLADSRGAPGPLHGEATPSPRAARRRRRHGAEGPGLAAARVGQAGPAATEPLLLAIRDRTSRLVLRTACERLPPPRARGCCAKQRLGSGLGTRFSASRTPLAPRGGTAAAELTSHERRVPAPTSSS